MGSSEVEVIVAPPRWWLVVLVILVVATFIIGAVLNQSDLPGKRGPVVGPALMTIAVVSVPIYAWKYRWMKRFGVVSLDDTTLYLRQLKSWPVPRGLSIDTIDVANVRLVYDEDGQMVLHGTTPTGIALQSRSSAAAARELPELTAQLRAAVGRRQA